MPDTKEDFDTKVGHGREFGFGMAKKLDEAVNKSFYKLFGDMLDGNRPVFLDKDEGDQKLAELRRGVKELLVKLTPTKP